MSKYEKELEMLRRLYDIGLFSKSFYVNKLTCKELLGTYQAFQKIPFCNKYELRNTSAFERTNTLLQDVYGIFSSSGTTGNKTYYIYSNNDKVVHKEFVRTFYTEIGINEQDLGCILAPVGTDVMAHTMMWQFTEMGAAYVNCPEPSPDNIVEIVSTLPVSVVATRPYVASSIWRNPKYVAQAQKSDVTKLLLGGGFLSFERRKLLERIWNAECFNMFGMSEMFGPMAGECKMHNGQHYLDKYLMVEIINPVTGMPVDKGEIGVAVYTSLWEKGFPLLRYWSNDLIRIVETPCECGSTTPRIFYSGRANDCIKINDKYVFPEELENCLMKQGLYGDYCAVMKNDGTVSVTVEQAESSIRIVSLKTEVEHIFCGTPVEINFAKLGGLRYDGHGIRFASEIMEK